MSEDSINNSSILGDLVQVLRQRYFINHNPDAKTLLVEEYTIIGNKDGVDNIILQSPYFFPNLTVYDSDREELPVMPNRYTKILIKSWISQAADIKEQKHLKQILDDMKLKKPILYGLNFQKRKNLKKINQKL